jgi:hypothetical protein
MPVTINPVNIPITREEGIAISLEISHLTLKGIRRTRLRTRLDRRISQVMSKNLFLPRDRE